MSASTPHRRTGAALVLGLLVFLATAGLSAGNFHTADEISMYTAAVNVVDRGQWHTNQLGWGQWALRPGEEQGTLNAQDDLYSKKSPLAIALMVPLVALGRLVPAIGPLRAVLLLGPLLTALAAVGVLRLGERLGYGRPAALTAALAFAFTTMALPFSRLAMRELAASLGLLLAVYGWLEADQGRPGRRAELVCGLGAAACVGANAAYLLVLPLFAAALALVRRPASLRALAARLGVFVLPAAGVGALLAAYNLARFGSLLDTGYAFVPGQEGFSSPVWWGAAGLLFSPARGLFWYNPPALLSLAAWPRFHRAHRGLSTLLLALAAGHLLVFGAWWEWWGGYTWGPRFLLPLVPLLMLLALPLFQSVTAPGGRPWARLAVGLVLAAGLAVQLAGSLIDYNRYEIELETAAPVPAGQPLLYHHDPGLVYDLARSPLAVHLHRLGALDWDLAWWPGRPAPRSIPEIAAALRGQARPGDHVLYLAPELLEALLEQPGLPEIYGLPVNVSAADPLARRLFERARRGAERVWLVTWYGPADPGNWVEADLRGRWASLSEAQLDGYRVMLFARPPAADLVPAGETFGPLRLQAQSAHWADGLLVVTLEWQALRAPGQDYTTFVHVLGPDGQLLAGQDRPPQGGYRPTSGWGPGEVITDRFGFALPAGLPPGAQVAVGWYAWPSLERLPASDAQGRRLPGDSLPLPLQP